jgi:polysaccharide export outer membrane protein
MKLKYVWTIGLFFLGGFCLFSGWSSADNITTQQEVKDHYQLGQIDYQNGLYPQAQQEFQKALELSGGAVVQKENQEPIEIVSKNNMVQEQPEPVQIPENNLHFSEYLIGAGDVLYVSVWENPDLTMDVIVRPDGRISFPLIHELQAEGLTLVQLSAVMKDKLKEFIRVPDVSVSLRQISGAKIIILGEVRNPGRYSLEDHKNLLEAIALAGGFTRDAVTKSVVVIHNGLDKPVAERIDLNVALRTGKNNLSDIPLRSQDIIFVPSTFISDVSYFMRQFLDPISNGATTSSDVKAAKNP